MFSVISLIPFRDVHYLESCLAQDEQQTDTSLQEEVFTQVLLPLLTDDDPRVRQAVASNVVKMIGNFYISCSSLDGDPITSIGLEYTRKNLGKLSSPSKSLSITPSAISSQLLFPSDLLPDSFDFIHPFVSGASEENLFCDDFEENLLYVVELLQNHIMSHVEDKKSVLGCLKCLEQLSKEYLPTKYPMGWKCITPDSNSCISFLRFLLSLFSSSSNPLVFDLTIHQTFLSLMGYVLSGFGYHAIKVGILSGLNLSDAETKDWGILESSGRDLSLVLDSLTNHLLKLLHLFNCVLEETPATQLSKRESGFSSLTTGLFSSPIRRNKSKTSDGSNGEKMSEKRQSTYEPILDQNYYKFLDVFRGNYSSYKSSIEMNGPNRFKSLLETVLTTLSQVMEMSTLKYMSPKIDVILDYLKSTTSICPVESIICMQQLLKCIFGTNFSLLMVPEKPESDGTYRPKPNPVSPYDLLNPQVVNQSMTGLFQTCISIPYREFTNTLQNKTFGSSPASGYNISWSEEVSLFKMIIRKNFDKRVAGLLDRVSPAPDSHGSRSSFAAHIKSFEPLVIRSLKMYTTSSDTELQGQVLSLLSLLVKLRVNYCLLDSDQVFLGFVLKQFEFIESGQIHSNPQKLIDRIFTFMLLLTYERFDPSSKMVMDVPKIIQMSNGLLASGQPTESCVIPASQHLVEDLFIYRSPVRNVSTKELDTQKEVIISTLLKVACYPKSMEQMLIVIQESRRDGGDEKWKKVSRLIIDVLFPLLNRQQLMIDDVHSLETLMALFDASSPGVFRPVDFLLMALFSRPRDDILENQISFQRWMALILVSLKVMMVQSKEDIILTRLEELKSRIVIGPHGLPVMDQDFYPQKKSPAVSHEDNEETEDFLSQYLLQVLELFVYQLAKFTSDVESQSFRTFTSQILSHYCLLLTHMFQSGSMRRVAKSASLALKHQRGNFDVSSVNLLFEELELSNPTLVIQWCNILMLLGFDDNGTHDFWYKLIGRCSQSTVTTPIRINESESSMDRINMKCDQDSMSETSFPSSHIEMIRRGTIVLLCDFSCENTSDAEQMTWLIVNNIREIIKWSYELPVKDFINSIHRNSASSALFIQAINSRCLGFDDPTFVRKVVNCLEFIHPTQSGPLVVLIIEHIVSNPSLQQFSTLVSAAERMAIERLQMILKSDDENEIQSQLSFEDVKKLLSIVSRYHYPDLHHVLQTFESELNGSKVL